MIYEHYRSTPFSPQVQNLKPHPLSLAGNGDGLAEGLLFMTDRVKIVCSNCRKPFGERAARLKNGYQCQCPNCMRLIIFDSSSEDPNIRRPLKAARDIRHAAEDALVLARMSA
jgi:DNA-directed RNA polymerase subunit RPC12/RpoP